MKRMVWFLVVALVSGCSEPAEVAQVCRRAPELESSLVAVDESLDSLATMRPRLLQSSLAVLGGTLSILREVAPTSVAGQIEIVERAYDDLDASLAAVFYDGSVAVSDDDVARAISEIRGNDMLDALERVRRFVSDRCVVELGYAPPAQGATGSTLPGPPIVGQPPDDIESGFDDDASAMRAYGRLVAELYGRSLDDAQAECLGAALNEAALADPVSSAERFDELVASFLGSCTSTRETVPSTVP